MSTLEWLGDMAAMEEVPGEPSMVDAPIETPSLPIAVSVVSYGIETRLGHRVQNLFEELALDVAVAYLDCRSLRKDPGETVSHWEDGAVERVQAMVFAQPGVGDRRGGPKCPLGIFKAVEAGSLYSSPPSLKKKQTKTKT